MQGNFMRIYSILFSKPIVVVLSFVPFTLKDTEIERA